MSKINDLKQHQKNANEGTEYGEEILKRSIEKYKIGKSIVVDKDNNIIAGNHVTGKLAEMGMEDVHIVESEGDIAIAVQRTDIDIDTEEGKLAAIADNRASELNLAWNAETLEKEYGKKMMEKYNLEDLIQEEYEEEDDDDESWENKFNNIRAVKLIYSRQEYDQIIKALQKAKDKTGLETNTQIFRKIVNESFAAHFEEEE